LKRQQMSSSRLALHPVGKQCTTSLSKGAGCGRVFHTRDQGTQKMKEADISRVSRVKAFLHFMSYGHRCLSDWSFLYNAKTVLSAKEKKLVTTSMCHDTRTADRFYSHNQSVTEAMRVRHMKQQIMKASTVPSPMLPGTSSAPSTEVPGPSSKPGGRRSAKAKVDNDSDSNSGKDMEVSYQESGTLQFLHIRGRGRGDASQNASPPKKR
ncbi:hypothetical protein GOODEAATRI_019968, partial [Goodea atripinnis]